MLTKRLREYENNYDKSHAQMVFINIFTSPLPVYAVNTRKFETNNMRTNQLWPTTCLEGEGEDDETKN